MSKQCMGCVCAAGGSNIDRRPAGTGHKEQHNRIHDGRVSQHPLAATSLYKPCHVVQGDTLPGPASPDLLAARVAGQQVLGVEQAREGAAGGHSTPNQRLARFTVTKATKSKHTVSTKCAKDAFVLPAPTLRYCTVDSTGLLERQSSNYTAQSHAVSRGAVSVHSRRLYTPHLWCGEVVEESCGLVGVCRAHRHVENAPRALVRLKEGVVADQSLELALQHKRTTQTQYSDVTCS